MSQQLPSEFSGGFFSFIIKLMNIFDIIEKEITRFDRVYILGHIQPDGDCIGSSLGLYYLIKENYGRECIVVNEEIEKYSYLGSWTVPGSIDYRGSLAIQVDNSVRNRSCDCSFMDASVVIKIDHHIVIDSYGTYNEERMTSSCCEIIASDAIEKGLRMTQDAAACLYTGMSTDSGNFMYSGVSSSTLFIASKLLETKIDVSEFLSKAYERNFNTVKFIAEAYNRMKVTEKGVLWIYIPQEIEDKYSLSPDMVSEALSCMRNIKDHPVYVLFSDLFGKIRVEFRSQGIAVNEVASSFGGGGHKFASGARLKSAEEIPLVLDALDKLM